MADEKDLKNIPEDTVEDDDPEPKHRRRGVRRAAHGPVLDAAAGIGQVLDGLPGEDAYTPPQNDRPPPGAPPKAI